MSTLSASQVSARRESVVTALTSPDLASIVDPVYMIGAGETVRIVETRTARVLGTVDAVLVCVKAWQVPEAARAIRGRASTSSRPLRRPAAPYRRQLY